MQRNHLLKMVINNFDQNKIGVARILKMFYFFFNFKIFHVFLVKLLKII